MKTHLAVHGAAGRMGQRIIALAREDRTLSVVAAVDQAPAVVAGFDGEVTVELPHAPRIDCVIDFSSPDGTLAILRTCIDRKLPLVIATTGLEAHHKAEIASAAHLIPVLQSPNMSLVVNLLFRLTKLAADALSGKAFDVEIVERYHRHKNVAPSGTALHLARIIQDCMHQKRIVHGREGHTGERLESEIGLHAIRGGDNVGEHAVIFAGMGETLELVHKASSRDSYARGALLAAKYLIGKGAGSYTMADVLGLS